MDNLRGLCNAVNKANVFHLTVDGTHFKNPALDFANRTRRYDPILQLASNLRVQYLQLKDFDDFFFRFSKSSLTSAPKLRGFSTDVKAAVKDKDFKTFNGFLNHCPSLTTLEQRLDREHSVTMVVSDILSVHKLESLKICRGELSISANVSDGMMEVVDLAVEQLGDLSLDDLKVIKKDHLKRLAIYHTPLEADKLTDLLYCTPVLGHLQIGYKDERRFSAPLLGIELQDIIKMIAPETTSKLESLSIDYKRLSLTANFSQGQIHEMTVKTVLSYLHIRRLGEPCLTKATTLDMKLQDLMKDHSGNFGQSQVILARLPKVDFECEPITRRGSGHGSTIPQESDGNRLADILRHNPALQQFHIEFKEERGLSNTTAPELKLQDLHASILSVLPRIASSFPTRNSFPNWVCNNVLDSTEKIVLQRVYLHPQEWKAVIEAIDLSGLHLNLYESNITHEAFKLLVDRIPDNTSKVTLKALDTRGTSLAESADSHAMLAELQKRAPLVKILAED
ncbi:hypothetical protein BGZ65_004419 [Modicella reniformis]|uniref:Uncharacterized protein n=1 Tax=Modicella reniformis TaxID=1440133 RepID=A0A9P6LZ34_9FUNG|nr:hypothetical protein BGZ65_004419 [Modicella reniformis]